MLAIALLLLQLPDAAALFDPVTGYRVAQYRGVVPSPPADIPRIDDATAARLRRGHHAIFLDVMPAAGGVRDPATGVWQLAESHATIPGAHWFPEAGRGPIDRAIDSWFLRGVARLARGARRRTLVVFCLADCWMSWNASIKLRRAGYHDVRWYANGADGWRDIGGTLVAATPER